MPLQFIKSDALPEWEADCEQWRGKTLTGTYAHWCADWDGLPIDETCMEWPCACAESLQKSRHHSMSILRYHFLQVWYDILHVLGFPEKLVPK